MKRQAARLPIALTTFLFSLFITAALTKVTPTHTAPNCDKRPPPNATPAASPPNSLHSEPTRAADKTPRVSQQEIVNFPGVGQVKVTAFETFGESVHLEFRDANTDKLLHSEFFFGDDAVEGSAENPWLRFRVLHIKGVPNPLIVAASVTPAADHDDWKSAAVGVVNGRFVNLTSEQLEGTDQGGFYYGDLGRGRGFGAISWNFVWGNESHPDPHQYELKVYTWNPKTASLEWHQVLRTRGKFDDGEEAVRSLGFNVRDALRTFPDWE
ncbi:MAG: hypothetical protein ACJ741_08460 [Pyrinomonadaceae bacterium]